MPINSINTNIAAYYAQANISKASALASASVSRLSSGNRIVKASDDVAALSIGTGLTTSVSALRTALTNASQGTSLLQVADGALSQVTEILQRQRAIAFQAGSGTLRNEDRVFLNQEFSALSAEVDRLTGNTNFNGVKLLNGSLSTAAGVNTNTNASSGGVQRLTFTDNIATGESITIGGVNLVGLTTPTSDPRTFQVTGSLTGANGTLQKLADALNNLASNATYGTSVGQAVYSVDGNSLVIKSRTGGSLSNNFTTSSVATQSLFINGTGVNIAATSTAAASDFTVSLANSGYVVGQKVTFAGLSAVGGITFGSVASGAYEYTITAVTATDFSFAQSGTAGNTTPVAQTNTATVSTATASYTSSASFGEATPNGGYGGVSFNLFSTSAATSASTVVSADAAAAGTPFQNGNSITATVNGVTKTLYTIGAASDGGAKTIKDIVDGINANTATTGFKAVLVYSAGAYNIRLSSPDQVGAVVIDYGANFTATNYAVNGQGIGRTAANDDLAATAATKSIFGTGYIDYFTSATVAIGDLVTTVVSGTGTQAATPFLAGNTITINQNGKSEILHTLASGDTLTGIVTSINARTADTGVTALVVGTGGSYNIRLYVNDSGQGAKIAASNRGTDNVTVSTQTALGGGVAINTANTSTIIDNSGSTFLTALQKNSNFGLAGGTDNGISAGGTSITGSVGNSILTSLSQTRANSSLIFTANATALDTVTIGGKVFTFSSNTTRGVDEVLIGSTISETIDNLISTIKTYVSTGNATGEQAFELNQLDLTRSGNSFVITGKGLGNITTLDGGSATIARSNTTGTSLTNGTLNNAASTYGIDTTGVTNADFRGTLQGFKATYAGTADTVNLSIKIGKYTYTAKNLDTTVTSNTRVRLYSDEVDGASGGYFDVQLAANAVTSGFSDQAGADAIASRFNVAFTTLNFNQKRQISSFTGTQGISSNGAIIGSLVGTKVAGQFTDFDNLKLSDVKITAPTGSATDAKVTLVINGVNYSSAVGLGTKLGANQTIRLTSEADVNQFVEFTTGDTTIDISSAANAAAVQTALKDAFGAKTGSAALSFQIGTSAADSLAVSISSAGTSSLFNGESLDVLTQANASRAAEVLDAALNKVTSIRADVGALQSRFNFASANIQITIQNQDAARGELLETDIASESTNYATAQVKLQAGISVLAQANQQLQALLKLIG